MPCAPRMSQNVFCAEGGTYGWPRSPPGAFGGGFQDREVRQIVLRVAPDEVEKAVPAGVHAGRGGHPGHRALRLESPSAAWRTSLRARAWRNWASGRRPSCARPGAGPVRLSRSRSPVCTPPRSLSLPAQPTHALDARPAQTPGRSSRNRPRSARWCGPSFPDCRELPPVARDAQHHRPEQKERGGDAPDNDPDHRAQAAPDLLRGARINVGEGARRAENAIRRMASISFTRSRAGASEVHLLDEAAAGRLRSARQDQAAEFRDAGGKLRDDQAGRAR